MLSWTVSSHCFESRVRRSWFSSCWAALRALRSECQQGGTKKKPRRKIRVPNVLVEEDIEATKVGDRLLDGLDAVRLTLQVERKEKRLAESTRLLVDVVADVLGVLLLLRQVDDRAAGTE